MSQTAAGQETGRAARNNLAFNVLLMVLKLVVGIWARSEALIADGLHSGADVFSSVAVMVGLAIAGRPPDSGHHYGHAKAEAISQKVVAVLLLLAGLEVANSAIAGIEHPGPAPDWIALAVALVAMVPKGVMAVTQRRLAKRTGSHAILAAATDNVTDAISSLVASLGILASRLGYASGDSVAALVVAALVMWAGVDVFRTAAVDLMDPAADPETTQALRERAQAVAGVLSLSSMRTRLNGARIFVDLEIEVDRHLSLLAAHDIAHQVEDALKAEPRVEGVTVHVNPAGEDGKG
ncbi:cation diffusion facilitator family transporter [Sulfobacillus harzensis]|uniref:Cation transporter n=1 Tax=Sulfobacillus harzensis TaxID=2729629 RepID=A0A7Y0L5X8_9FIRM|nr:cation diffusion facilitator family transporter [Sulfobacillus harzensis]NMP22509.1 cation transporter [Sulfobacillus harzensis]